MFGEGPADAWAVYRLDTRSYAGLTRSAKHGDALDAGLTRLRARGRLLAAARRAPLVRRRTTASASSRRSIASTSAGGARRIPRAPRPALGMRATPTRPEVYRQRPARRTARQSLARDIGGFPALEPLRRDLRALRRRDAISGRSPRGSAAPGGAACSRALLDYIDCESSRYPRDSVADPARLLPLARRTRIPDEHFKPQALVVEGTEEEGGVRFQPLEADVLRLFDSPINVETAFAAGRVGARRQPPGVPLRRRAA